MTSESVEPNDNDLELKAVAYAFSKIFQPETCWNVAANLTVRTSSFGDQELLSFVDLAFRPNEKRKKHLFYTVEDFAQF